MKYRKFGIKVETNNHVIFENILDVSNNGLNIS